MEYELHEQILLFLFERRHTNETYNLLEEFKDADSELVTDRAQYLYENKYIYATFPSGFGVFNFKTGEYTHSMTISDSVDAKILPDGIDYVKKEIMKKPETTPPIKIGNIKDSVVVVGNKAGGHSPITPSQKKEVAPKTTSTSSMLKKIFILVVAGVLVTIILYWLFGTAAL